jgi:hypothetical protein
MLDQPQCARPRGWRHSRRLFLICALAGISGATMACAEEPAAGADEPNPDISSPGVSKIVGVVELFTSQGCSSCPPADQLLKTYAARSDVLALSLPVDYWDYLGWKDTFGNAKYTERQRNYAKSRGDGKVYTPQAVVNGMLHVNGASAKDIDAALTESEAKLAPERVPLRFSMNRGSIMIETGAADPAAPVKESTIWLAVIQKSADVVIEHGENRGKTLSYTNVVRELTPVGTWTGQPMRIQLARSAIMRPGMESVAVLIQQGKAGPIIGAALSGLW